MGAKGRGERSYGPSVRTFLVRSARKSEKPESGGPREYWKSSFTIAETPPSLLIRFLSLSAFLNDDGSVIGSEPRICAVVSSSWCWPPLTGVIGCPFIDSSEDDGTERLLRSLDLERRAPIVVEAASKAARSDVICARIPSSVRG